MKLTPGKIGGVALLMVTLATYYPALYAPLNPLDDHAIVERLLNQQTTSLGHIFTRTTDYYYRPLLWLTYLGDYHLFGAETSFMHLGNMLLHAANVLLLFGCVRVHASCQHSERLWLPFVAALLFAIHPVNTEAVNWIAARSDLLAGFFVLLSAFLLFLSLRRRLPALAWLSLLALLPGCLSKETALFFLPAALAIIYCNEPGTSGRGADSMFWRERMYYGLPYLLLPVIYFVVRGPAFLHRDGGLMLFRKFREFDPFASLSTILSGLGFYAKKLVWPWPLNLAIDHVPPGYLWLGLLVVAGLGYAVWRRGEVAGLLLATFFLCMSALLALFLRPAWTPVAERYLYIPSAFLCMGAVPLGYHLVERFPNRRTLSWVLVFGLIAVATSTFVRNLLWLDNIRLLEDTVRKSPDFPFAKSVLAGLMMEAGRKEEGAEIIRTNNAPAGLRNADFLDLQRATLLHEEKRYAEARSLILEKRRRDGQLYYRFQEVLLRVDGALLGDLTRASPPEILAEYIALHRELHAVYREPLYLYLLGQVYMKLDDRENAAHCFHQAAESAPPGAHYQAAAKLLAAKMMKP